LECLAHVEAQFVEVQARSPHGREHLGPSQELGQSPQLLPRTARPRPQQHGQRRKSKVSDYGIQLRAKQKLKGYYGDVTEKQFKRTYQEAARMKGDTGQNLIGLLYRRLHKVVYRAKFAPTIFSARQIVSHGHIRVNGVKCNIASRRVVVGDVISLGAKAKDMALIAEAQ